MANVKMTRGEAPLVLAAIHNGHEIRPDLLPYLRLTERERLRELAKVLRPKLVQDGMFLVGVDIVGDKLMEINVFSPGGVHAMTDLYEEDFCAPVIDSIERKVEFKKTYKTYVDNITLATL